MIGRLVIRHLALHPIRSLVFVGGYAAGVAVMLALLSIGEVMVEQSRDEEWLGGGDITVVPAGVDLETLRTGGAVFFGIEQARFIARSILGGPRLAEGVQAWAPWLDNRAVYLRRDSTQSPVAVRANGLIPTAAIALAATPEITAGNFRNSASDRRWLDPTPLELYSELDRFHLPPERVRGDSTWAEWHYFNLLWPDQQRWLYLSFILGGDLLGKRWGGLVLASYRAPDGKHLSFADTLGADEIRFTTDAADVSFGPHSVRLRDDPIRYEIDTRLTALKGGDPLDIELEVRPLPNRYFPPAQLTASDSFVSGYVVPALRATAAGQVCQGGRCFPVEETIAYHDHNWGTWGGVAWDWGIAHAGDYDVLYGGVHGAAAGEARRRGARLLGYVVDSLGVAAVLEPRELVYSGAQTVVHDGEAVEVPEQLTWTAAKGADSLTAKIELRRIVLSNLTLGGDAGVYFAQMQGSMNLTGRIGGQDIQAEGPGFFETYLLREKGEP
ncbi:MAG: hypothetical protein JSU87_10875 [Gemmatimonadota bacterium]|nr:MAG: hypothetical protein JSU87_10875 [Gemmatimonadota bacterium]